MLLSLALAASRRGWRKLSALLLELDLALAGLAGESRRIRRSQRRRRRAPKVFVSIEFTQ